MTKTEYRDYIASEHWQERRREFLLKKTICQDCEMPRWLASIVYDHDLHVHHVSYGNLGQELDSDLAALCRRCHDIKTFGRSDLVSPPCHACAGCDETTWNTYSDYCARCAEMLSLGMSIPERLVYRPISSCDVMTLAVWEATLLHLGFAVGLDKLMSFLGEHESGIELVHTRPTTQEQTA